jgi:predicted protein tyrosine phosphatase
MNILFVCSRNRWRSLTAETLFKDDQRHRVRSAGTAEDARIKVTGKLVIWAELIFVMEKKHKQKLEQKFQHALEGKQLVVLDIEDNYKYMDKELIEILKGEVSPYLEV